MKGERKASGDRGATLIIFALLLIALFTISALVIDLSFVRQNRQVGKSVADFAAAAGVQSLDNGSGEPQTWAGICAARDFLVANNSEFLGMTETYSDGTGTAVSSPCVPPVDGTLCVDTSRATWGVLSGSADGGRLLVTIRNGYELPDAAFPEDGSSSYASDLADPCLQVAVVVEEREDPYFGGVTGSAGHETRIRSVARAQRSGGEIAAALILLERTHCQALTASGTGATIRAMGRDDAPGTIHVDSLASDAACANNKKLLDVDGGTSPGILALASTDGSQPGSITTVSLTGAATAQPQFTADSPSETCVQATASDCVSAPFTGAALTGRNLVSRSVVDTRYIEHIRDIRGQAFTRSGWNDAAALAAGFTPLPCNTPTFASATQKIFINCDGGEFTGTNKTLPSNHEVVINGSIAIGNGQFNLGDNTKVFVRGVTGGNNRAIFLGTNNTLTQNVGTAANCDARYAQDSSARGLLVIANGYLGGNGGVLRLCQTTVVMLDTRGASSCPIPSTNGIAPYENSCVGQVDISGGAVVDWTAPNVNDSTTPSDAELKNLEDLALWSETQSSQGISGGGGMNLGGIFFTPNADPFTLNGGGSIDLFDAQFISRKLRATGGGTLTLSPKAPNSVTLPALEGFSLVR